MSDVYLGIGSNLGDREDNCRSAISALSRYGIKALSVSSAIETKPWGVTEQPDFINMAVKVSTALEPAGLLHLLKKIEYESGRRPGSRWGPRVIDLDILFYDTLVMKTDELEIPHPDIQNRAFVLVPLAEIAHDFLHPVLKKSIGELLEELEDTRQ